MHEDSNTLNVKAIGDGAGFGGLGGGGGIWAILLLALLGGGGVLGARHAVDPCAATAGIAAANARFTGIEAQLENLERGQTTAAIIAAVAAVREDIREGTTATVAGFVNVGNKLDQGFFNVERTATANTQLILNKIDAFQVEQLKSQLCAANSALSNCNQTHHLEHFVRNELRDSLGCIRREFSDAIRSSVGSGNSAGGVGSGNGSNNTSYELNFAQGFQRGLAAATKTA